MRVYTLSNYLTFNIVISMHFLPVIGPLFTTNILYHIPAGSRYPLSLLLFVFAVPSNYKETRAMFTSPYRRQILQTIVP